MDKEKLDYLERWYRSLYRSRTIALRNDMGKLDWINSGTRVSFSEVCFKADELGLIYNVVDLRKHMKNVRRK